MQCDSLKIIYLLSLLKIVPSPEQKAYLFSLYKPPYILSSLFTSSHSKLKTFIFHLTRLNTGTTQLFLGRCEEKMAEIKNKQEQKVHLICKCLELLILAVFGRSWLCVQSTMTSTLSFRAARLQTDPSLRPHAVWNIQYLSRSWARLAGTYGRSRGQIYGDEFSFVRTELEINQLWHT